MKAYCKSCEAIQPSSFRPCTDAVTGASYEDLCCDSCHYIVATIEEREALAQPEQEPVAWGVFEGNLHDMFFTEAEAVEMAQLKGTHAEVKPLYIKEKNNAA